MATETEVQDIECNHARDLVGYNTSIVILECMLCGDVVEEENDGTYI